MDKKASTTVGSNMIPLFSLIKTVQHPARGKPLGIRNWLQQLKNRFPELRFGYFNPPLR